MFLGLPNLGLNGRQNGGPALNLDFVSTETLDSRISYSGGAGGSRTNSAGLIVAASAPRFDYDPISLAAKGLLVEEQRTNVWIQSGDVASANKTNSAGCLSDQDVAPDGTTTGSFIVSDAGVVGYVSRSISHTALETRTHSVCLKPAGRTTRTLLAPPSLFTDAANRSATFTLTGSGSISNLTGTGASATIQLCGNGYYRCTLTYTPDNTLVSGLQIRDTSVGDGTTGVYAWGVQNEAGTFATTYIPTTTVAVTRTTDSVVINPANMGWFTNSTSFTVYTEADTASTALAACGFAFNDNSASNGTRLSVGTTGTTRGYLQNSGGVLVANIVLGASVANTAYKVAAAVELDNVYAASGGVGGVLDTSAALPIGLDRARIGALTLTNSVLNGHVRSAKYWPYRMTNAEIVTLTA